MNLLLLQESDFRGEHEVSLTGRPLQHAREVLRAQAGQALRVGVRNGKLGTGEILHIDDHELRLRVQLTEDPPPRANIDLILGIPRPKQLKRIIPAVASLGIGTLVLVSAQRVEKSYFDSRVLNDAFLDALFVQGLEQAKDTIAPRVLLRDRFRPFVEDELDLVFPGAQRLLPHPPAKLPLSGIPPGGNNVVLAIGPEGGWIPFEAELLASRGFVPFSLGPRVLRTEAAVPLLVGQTLLWRERLQTRPA